MGALTIPLSTPALVLFGRDHAGKPHASWFDAPSIELATKAAGLMSMRAVPIVSDELRELATSLPRGRLFSSGRAFTPFIKSKLYDRLVEVTRDMLGLEPASPAPAANSNEPSGDAAVAPAGTEDAEAGVEAQPTTNSRPVPTASQDAASPPASASATGKATAPTADAPSGGRTLTGRHRANAISDHRCAGKRASIAPRLVCAVASFPLPLESTMASTTAAADATRALNDQLRRTVKGGIVVFSQGAIALGNHVAWRVLHAVATFDPFDADDDPYGEHDFGTVLVDGERFFWKIDYYDQTMQAHSPDPADAAVTERVLTIMRADEY